MSETQTNPILNGISGGLGIRNLDATAGNATGIEFLTSAGNRNATIYALKNTANAGGSILFGTHDGTAFAERVRISSAGNVGIGTTSPTYSLHIKSGGSNDVGLQVDGTTTNSAYLTFINGGGRVWIGEDNSAGNNLAGTGGIAYNLGMHAYGASQPLQFTTNGAVRMTIRETGNVGIGTSTPTQKLEVVGTVKATSFDGAGTLPVGAIILWMESATCPSGFTRVTALDGRFTLGSATPGVTGGFSSHSHTFGFSGTTGPSGGISVGTSGFITGAAPPNHVHGFSGGGTTDFSSSLPPFTSVLFCRRAAPVLASAGGVQANVSDVALKENFAPVDGKPLLARLAAIPIQTWNYKSEDRSIRHMGPMAQDFYAAFALGEDDKHINTVDSGGVALAAIRELHRMSLEVEKKTVELEAKSKTLEDLSRRIEALERLVKGTQTAWRDPER
ncbi:tail fiber domain-containing protein [bacterium]|nr:MAG: tail fiber domain-containing protein [bacterium]